MLVCANKRSMLGVCSESDQIKSGKPTTDTISGVPVGLHTDDGGSSPFYFLYEILKESICFKKIS